MNKITHALFSYNGMLGLIVLLMTTYLATTYQGFFSMFNFESISLGFIGEAFIALGMLLVIILRGIDLSVASILPFSAIVVSMLLKSLSQFSDNVYLIIFIAISITLILCALIGAINGQLINRLKVHPFIVTLAMALVVRGINLVITDGGSISQLPDEFSYFGQNNFLEIPYPVWLFIIFSLIFGYLLTNTKYLQQIYFIGGKEESARLSGIDVDRFKIFAWTFSAVMAGIAGIIYASQFASANMAFGQNIELRVIAAVFIGGASMFGGIGTFTGTMLGVIFFAILYNGYTWTGINTYYQDIVVGVMLVLSVLIGAAIQKKREDK